MEDVQVEKDVIAMCEASEVRNWSGENLLLTRNVYIS